MPQVSWELAADFTDPQSGLTVRVEQLMLAEPRYSLSMGMLRQDLSLSRYIQDRFLTPAFKEMMQEFLDKGYAYITQRRAEDQARKDELIRAEQERFSRRDAEQRAKKKRQEENHQRRAEENRARAARAGGGKKKG